MRRIAKMSHYWIVLRKGREGLIGLLSLWVCALSAAVPITFQFQGHLTDSGSAVEGQGFFKFSLVEEAGTGSEQVVWSNDDASGTMGEPSASIELGVERGVYSVAIGDTSLANMVAISPSIFESDGMALRVWFS